jgi:co-chaperonin GroES (HSP10)
MSDKLVYMPTGHHVLIEMDAVENVSKGGIILAHDTKREQGSAVVGVVKAIGDDCWFDKNSMWAKVGNKVLIAKFAGFAISDTLRVINDEDILAVIYDHSVKSEDGGATWTE